MTCELFTVYRAMH